MQVEHRIATLQKEANGDQTLFSKLWQAELAEMRRRDQQERADEENKNRVASTPFTSEERQKGWETKASDPAPKEKEPTVLEDIFSFFDMLAKTTRLQLEKLKGTPEVKP
jgi:hypothetical protein